jgi:hypothetical protein
MPSSAVLSDEILQHDHSSGIVGKLVSEKKHHSISYQNTNH